MATLEIKNIHVSVEDKQILKGVNLTVQSGEKGVRFLLISGRPIEEPVAWHGPIVMNTQKELTQAFKELRNGTFIRPPH